VPDISRDELTRALAHALETMAFVAPLPWEEHGPPPPPERAMRVRVRRRGAAPCELELIAGAGFGAYLAGNLIGSDASDPQAAANSADALRELMNVAAGALSRARGDAHLTQLAIDLPVLSEGVALSDWTDMTNDPEAVVLDADGHLVAVRTRSCA
jgi:hypothetical protein